MYIIFLLKHNLNLKNNGSFRFYKACVGF